MLCSGLQNESSSGLREVMLFYTKFRIQSLAILLGCWRFVSMVQPLLIEVELGEKREDKEREIEHLKSEIER